MSTVPVAGRVPAEPVEDRDQAELAQHEQCVLVTGPDVTDLGPGCHLHPPTVGPGPRAGTLGATWRPGRGPPRRQHGCRPGRPLSAGVLALTIFLVALNLRAALAALPPLVSTIQQDLGLSGATAGLLTTLPVLCMGLFAPAAQALAAPTPADFHRVIREAETWQ